MTSSNILSFWFSIIFIKFSKLSNLTKTPIIQTIFPSFYVLLFLRFTIVSSILTILCGLFVCIRYITFKIFKTNVSKDCADNNIIFLINYTFTTVILYYYIVAPLKNQKNIRIWILHRNSFFCSNIVPLLHHFLDISTEKA